MTFQNHFSNGDVMQKTRVGVCRPGLGERISPFNSLCIFFLHISDGHYQLQVWQSPLYGQQELKSHKDKLYYEQDLFHFLGVFFFFLVDSTSITKYIRWYVNLQSPARILKHPQDSFPYSPGVCGVSGPSYWVTSALFFRSALHV